MAEVNYPGRAWLAAAVILLVAGGLRLLSAGWGLPYSLAGDELHLLALEPSVFPPVPPLAWMGNLAAPPLSGDLMAPAVLAARLLTAGAGLLSLVIGYQLTRQRGFSRRAGVIVAALLAALPDAVVYGGRFHPAGWALLAVLAVMYCTQQVYRRRSVRWLYVLLACALLAVHLNWLLWPLLVLGALLGFWLFARLARGGGFYRFLLLLLCGVVLVIPAALDTAAALPGYLQNYDAALLRNDPVQMLGGWSVLPALLRIGVVAGGFALALRLWWQDERLQGAGLWGLVMAACLPAALTGWAAGGHLPLLALVTTWAGGAVAAYAAKVEAARGWRLILGGALVLWLGLTGFWLVRLGQPDSRVLLVAWLRGNLSAPEVIIWADPGEPVLHMAPGGLPDAPYWIVWEPYRDLYGQPVVAWREASLQYYVSAAPPDVFDPAIMHGLVYATPPDHTGTGPRYSVWRTYPP